MHFDIDTIKLTADQRASIGTFITRWNRLKLVCLGTSPFMKPSKVYSHHLITHFQRIRFAFKQGSLWLALLGDYILHQYEYNLSEKTRTYQYSYEKNLNNYKRSVVMKVTHPFRALNNSLCSFKVLYVNSPHSTSVLVGPTVFCLFLRNWSRKKTKTLLKYLLPWVFRSKIANRSVNFL